MSSPHQSVLVHIIGFGGLQCHRVSGTFSRSQALCLVISRLVMQGAVLSSDAGQVLSLSLQTVVPCTLLPVSFGYWHAVVLPGTQAHVCGRQSHGVGTLGVSSAKLISKVIRTSRGFCKMLQTVSCHLWGVLPTSPQEAALGLR